MKLICWNRRMAAFSGAVALALGLAASATDARATTITWTAGSNQAPDASFVKKDTFNDLSMGDGLNSTLTRVGYDITFAGTAQVFVGSQAGVARSPDPVSAAVAAAFAVPEGANTTPYLTAGNSQLTLTFDGEQKGLGLLWGSIDTYNSLSFYDANDNLIDTITGGDIISSGFGSSTAYINLYSTVAFKKVVASSSSYAFEFDNVAFTQAVPEPSSLVLALCPLALGTVVAVRRKVGRRTA